MAEASRLDSARAEHGDGESQHAGKVQPWEARSDLSRGKCSRKGRRGGAELKRNGEPQVGSQGGQAALRTMLMCPGWGFWGHGSEGRPGGQQDALQRKTGHTA